MMDIFLIFLIFILGLVVGSFLNVVIFRLETEEDIVSSRSKCMSCEHKLAWHDLFPVLSFLFLRGKCRYCKAKISFQYPLVEIVTGILFVLLFVKIFYATSFFPCVIYPEWMNFDFWNAARFFVLSLVFSALVVIFAYDLKHYIIPDEVVYSASALMLLFRMAELIFVNGGLNFSSFFYVLFPAFLAGGFFLFLVIATKGRGMGGGDVKLGFLMGLVLGFPNVLLALLIAFVSGAAVGTFLMALGKKKMKSMLPFGPFLVFGLLLSFFWGEEIIEWYWRGFLP